MNLENTLFIISERSSSRLDYVLNEIFTNHLGLSYKLVSSDDRCPHESCKIYYTKTFNNKDGLHLFQHEILFEDSIYAQRIEVVENDHLPYFFQSFAFKGDYKFDLFALVFYMLSRYEEYLRFNPDQHGRFSAQESLAYRKGFLTIPIVDRWIMDLRNKLIEKWSIEIPLKRSFQITPTIDIDTPFAYLHRPLIFHLGAITRDLFLFRTKRLLLRLKTYLGAETDLFDTYDYILQSLKRNNQRAIFFFLMNLQLPNDQNFSVNSKAFEKLIQIMCSEHDIGIHPSLQSHKSENQWHKELKQLQSISKSQILRSRQHFLQLSYPSSYQNLVSNGIKDEYSMMYHDKSGFRAGTSVPFNWYNLKSEKKEDLQIHPFMSMDVTLKTYEGLSPTEALEKIVKLKMEVKRVKGNFSFIWHNSSFAKEYGWGEWKEIFEECLKA